MQKKKQIVLKGQTIQKMSEARSAWWARKKAPKWKKAAIFIRELPSQLKSHYERRHHYQRVLRGKYEKTIHFVRTF